MLKPEIEAALNDQLNMEQTVAQDYLAMAAYFESQNLKGFATFMRAQSDEEREHAMKIYDYLCQCGGTVILQPIAAPIATYATASEVFKAAWKNEKGNTAALNKLYTLAREHSDYATEAMLQWFITEQIEEEAWCEGAVSLLEMAGDNPGAILMLDQKYGRLSNQESQ